MDMTSERLFTCSIHGIISISEATSCMAFFSLQNGAPGLVQHQNKRTPPLAKAELRASLVAIK